MNFSIPNLKKLEVLIKELGYTLRYEKGNFNSGYCILKDKSVVIVNKYFTDDVKFQKLIDIAMTIDISNINHLSDGSLSFLKKLRPSEEVIPNPIPFDDTQ